MPKLAIVPEALCPELVDEDAAFEAVSKAFAAMAEDKASNFPVVREAIGHADALYGFKGGFDRAGMTLGVKAGGYWPHNIDRGVTNHQSTVFLFNPDTGQPSALVGGNYLTAVRTAAAAAVSIRHLAREDSRVLGMIGAGHQSAFQMRAAVRQRHFEKVVAWNPHPEMLPRLAETAKELDLPFEAVELDQLGAEADVIITITSSFAPTLLAEHVRPGTHIACMGTDTKGKQEVEAVLLKAASVFTDEVDQSVTIGEAQHAIAEGLVDRAAITPIGAVIAGLHPGRASQDEITLFDGTGVALQDLAVAAVAVERARERGVAQEIEL
ncbi:iminosuccinate reductase BhcD [Nitratireductor sp. GCM10026969]|uniref:iminosuccinate reductase BhcD n=1 Tax=Nitratireductor sp. GCM10026969 TaxID=3252645 RepID=UPI00360FFAA7